MDFLNYVVETSKGWDEPNPREIEKMRPSANQRGGIYALSEDMEMKSRISTLARKVEELEGKQLHEVQAVTEKSCTNQSMCQFPIHCPPRRTVSYGPFSEGFDVRICKCRRSIQAPQPNAPYGNTYNSNGGITLTSPGNPIPLPMCPRCQTTVWFPISTTTTTILFSSGTSHFKLE